MKLCKAIVLALTGASLLAAQTTLREAAAMRAIPVGAAASADEYGPPDLLLNPSYAGLLSAQYSMLEPGNAMKWDVTQPTQTTFNFQPGDELVAFAQANHMMVRGHNLCWHSQFPQWLTPYAATATPDQMSTLLQNHITTEVAHFAGKVFAWDVVNEPFTDTTPSTLGDSIWYNQPGIGLTGTGYVEQALRWAHAADPNALLFINDYSIEGPGAKFTAMYNMVQDFVSRGVPINGVGFEMHIELGGYPSAAGLAQNMQQLAALGLQVHITEMDVRLQLNSQGAASGSDLVSQAQTYQTILSVCLQQPNCTAFQVWGVSYNDSWIPGFFPGYGAALPFDFNFQPTLAFNGEMTALQTTPPVLNANNMVNAASYHVGAVAPGEIVTLYGANFGPAKLTVSKPGPSGGFPTSLAGVQVLFDGVPAPLLYAEAGQVSAIVPFAVAGKQQTTIQYQYDPGTGPVVSNTSTANVTAAAPAIFALNASGSGGGAILNYPSYAVNNSANPAAEGSAILVFATGGGVVAGGAVDGGLAPGAAKLSATVMATIGGLPAKVLYAGSATGLVNGLVQVNLTVPTGLAAGPQPVFITIDNASSQAGLTVAVQPGP